MFKPSVGCKCLEERWVCVVIGFKVRVSKNLIIKRKGYFQLIVFS